MHHIFSFENVITLSIGCHLLWIIITILICWLNNILKMHRKWENSLVFYAVANSSLFNVEYNFMQRRVSSLQKNQLNSNRNLFNMKGWSLIRQKNSIISFFLGNFLEIFYKMNILWKKPRIEWVLKQYFIQKIIKYVPDPLFFCKYHPDPLPSPSLPLVRCCRFYSHD